MNKIILDFANRAGFYNKWPWPTNLDFEHNLQFFVDFVINDTIKIITNNTDTTDVLCEKIRERFSSKG